MLAAAQVSKNSDNSFTLKIQKNLVTSSGSYTFRVEVSDGNGGKLEHSIRIILTLIKEKAATKYMPNHASVSEKTSYTNSTMLEIKGNGQSPILLPKDDEDLVALQEMLAAIDLSRTFEERLNPGSQGSRSVKDQIQDIKNKMAEVDKLKNNILLKSQGFVKEPGVGFVFPAVNLTHSSHWVKSDLKRKRPRLQVRPIMTNGTLIFEFDQEMLVPRMNDSSLYEALLRLRLIRQSTHFEGKFIGKNQSLERKLEESFNLSDIAFNQTVLEHSALRLVIKLNFENSNNISSGFDQDTMQIEILQPELFRSSHPPYLSLDVNGIVQAEGNTILKPVPPQTSVETAVIIERTTKATSILFNSVSTGNFFISLLMSCSMQ